MKLFGNSHEVELKELVLAADVQELRMIANFLDHCASEIEKYRSDFDHEHLQDSEYALENAIPDIIVIPND